MFLTILTVFGKEKEKSNGKIQTGRQGHHFKG